MTVTEEEAVQEATEEATQEVKESTGSADANLEKSVSYTHLTLPTTGSV